MAEEARPFSEVNHTAEVFMKKFTQFGSIFAVAHFLAAAAVSAQTIHRIKADIPFRFNLADKSYDAGKYNIVLNITAAGGANVLLSDRVGNELARVFVVRTGDAVSNGSELVFSRYDRERFLSKLVIGNEAFVLARSENEKQIAKAAGDAPTQMAELIPIAH
jgi:hypothetical protein